MPQILDSCVEDVMKKQSLPKSRAFAICTAQLQKAGILKGGTQELTKKGGKRQSALAAIRKKRR